MINQAQINDDVLAKTNEIITEVNTQGNDIGSLVTEVNDHDSKIMQLLNWMGLVKDYVVETGSNANGSYEKWNSGKLVQRGKLGLSSAITTAIGSGFRGTQSLAFPIAFIDDVVEVIATSSNYTVSSTINILNTGCIVQLLSFDQNRQSNYTSWQAIGKWK
mgnify:FL=1